MRAVLLALPVASLAALLSTTAAQAACVEFPAKTYFCDGFTAGGLTDNDDDVSVTINSGAELENTTGASGGDALRVRGDNTTVMNNGTLTADGDGVDSGDGGTGLSVTNTGTINAQARGVNADGEDNVTVLNSGTINAPNNDGIRLGNGRFAAFQNTGTLISGDEGFEAGNDAGVRNGPGALIQALEDAVQVGERSTIINQGTIQSTGTDGDGIDMDSGTVVNGATGIITTAATGSAGIDFDASTVAESFIVNSGTIEGGIGIQVELGPVDPANTQSQIVLTDGIITGTGGIALELGEGDDFLAIYDSLTNASGFGIPLGSGAPAEINGDARLGDGNDTLGFFNIEGGNVLFDAVLDDLFDLGTGFDRVVFTDDFSTFAGASLSGSGVLTLSFVMGAMTSSIDFAGAEVFTFAADPRTRQGIDYTPQELLALTTPVPLPAGVLLLGGGLVALGAARARRRG